MPVDLQRKIVFVHIPKTGGTTIENSLGLNRKKFYCDHYPVTPISPQHLTMNELRQHFGQLTLNKCFKFAVTRHPVERLVSHFYWNSIIKEKTPQQFAQLVKLAETCVRKNRFDKRFYQHLIPQIYYTDGVDYYGKYETFQNTIDNIWKNSQIRRSQKPVVREIVRFPEKARKLLTLDLWNQIAEIYKQDFIKHNYNLKPPKWLK